MTKGRLRLPMIEPGRHRSSTISGERGRLLVHLLRRRVRRIRRDIVVAGSAARGIRVTRLGTRCSLSCCVGDALSDRLLNAGRVLSLATVQRPEILILTAPSCHGRRQLRAGPRRGPRRWRLRRRWRIARRTRA